MHVAVSDADLQRADGYGRITLSGATGATTVTDIFQRSPVRIVFPRIGNGSIEEAVFVNTAGGIAGGDRLALEVRALPHASIVVTSQTAEKIYRALHVPSRITTKLEVHEAARLAWLPQQTIVFNGARFTRETEIAVSTGAELLALESLVLGRAAHGERMTSGHIIDTWRVRENGRLIWADSFRITGETFAHLHRPALMADFKAIATMIYFGPSPEKRFEFMGDMVPGVGCTCAATSIAGLTILRFAAQEAFELKQALQRCLDQLRTALGPGLARVPKMWLS
jgi:urease accessory protein